MMRSTSRFSETKALISEVLVAQDMNLAREIAHAEHQPREDDQGHDGQFPLQVEQQHRPAHKAQDVADDVDEGAGEEPAQSPHVRRQARHQVADLFVVEKGHGKAQGTVEEVVLDVEDDLLLKAGEVELLQQAGQHSKHLDAGQQQHGPGQQTQLPAQDDVVNQVAGDEGLRKTKQGVEKDEESAQHALAPVPGDERAQVAEIGFCIGVAFPTGDAVLRQFPGEPPFQVREPGIHMLLCACLAIFANVIARGSSSV
jgi:hypothetical protein